jgi:hypothetical protein
VELLASEELAGAPADEKEIALTVRNLPGGPIPMGFDSSIEWTNATWNPANRMGEQQLPDGSFL